MKTSRQIPILHDNGDAISVCSDDGVLAFHLSPCEGGLFVERIEQRQRQARVMQSTVFRSARAFDRWCDADAVRFDYPVVYMKLKRNGDRQLP
jgi:hypothetical protein